MGHRPSSPAPTVGVRTAYCISGYAIAALHGAGGEGIPAILAVSTGAAQAIMPYVVGGLRGLPAAD